jgi:hypothetical protein
LSEEHGLDERYMGTLDGRGSCVKQSRQQALRFVKQAKPDIACYQGV